MKKLLTATLAGLFISGCSMTVPVSNFNQIPAVLNNNSTYSMKTISRVENQVDQKRLENLMAVLTGKKVFNGIKITERSSDNGRENARKYMISYLEGFGYKVERQQYGTSYRKGENIVAILPAQVRTDEYILVGAHYDTVSTAGADDNGTGTVAVIEAASVLRNLKNRKVNIIFSLFDQEERGLVGSKNMAKEYKAQGKNITSVHTLDMIGWDSDKDKAVEIERPDGNLWDYYVMVNKTHNLGLTLHRTSSGSTDHVAFHSAGFTAVGLCEEWANGDSTPYYHRPADTYETIDFEYLASTTRLLVAAIGDLSLKIEGPKTKFIPHENFPGKDHI